MNHLKASVLQQGASPDRPDALEGPAEVLHTGAPPLRTSPPQAVASRWWRWRAGSGVGEPGQREWATDPAEHLGEGAEDAEGGDRGLAVEFMVQVVVEADGRARDQAGQEEEVEAEPDHTADSTKA